jgi:septum formation protein
VDDVVVTTDPLRKKLSFMPSVILASGSKYRRELLQRLLADFVCESPDVDEASFHSASISPDQLARQLAMEKARVIANRFPDAIVIGSDQLVDLNQTVLGKPGSASAAVEQLMTMSGKTHRLVTAVCVAFRERTIEFANITTLTMRTLTRDEATRYVERDQPIDCAGSYKIESLGISLFDRIETEDFTAITGLPLIQLSRELRLLGVDVP